MGVYQLQRELGQGRPGQQGRREELEKVSMQCPLNWGYIERDWHLPAAGAAGAGGAME